MANSVVIGVTKGLNVELINEGFFKPNRATWFGDFLCLNGWNLHRLIQCSVQAGIVPEAILAAEHSGDARIFCCPSLQRHKNACALFGAAGLGKEPAIGSSPHHFLDSDSHGGNSVRHVLLL